jgi:cytochrome bd-type quinol oxidase subunit 2
MNKSNILNIDKIAIALLGSIFVLLAVVDLPADLKGLTVEDKDAVMANSKLALMTNFTLFTVVLGAILVVGFFAYGLVTDTKKTVRAVIGYLLAGLAFLLFYALAKGTPTTFSVDHDIAKSTLKATEAGMYLTIFMVVIGFILMLVGPLFRYIKK